MNCLTYKSILDDLIDGELDAQQRQACQDHIDSCSVCANDYQLAANLSSELSLLQSSLEAELNNDLSEEMSREIWNEFGLRVRNKPVANGFQRGFIAASVLAFTVFIAQFSVNHFAREESQRQITFALLEQKDIHLMLSSEQDEAVAVFTIEVPENFHYTGKEALKLITWEAPLLKGNNLLTIPISAFKHGTGVLKTTVKIGGKTQTLNVILNTHIKV